MPSVAAVRFREALERAQILRDLTWNAEIPIGSRQIHYHASLAATVAAWEIYIHGIVEAFFTETSTPSDARFHTMHTIAREEAYRRLRRFHTPNWENARELLAFSIGYDPIQDWVWRTRGLGGQQVRDFLNEILRIRHSFAHGHAMPSFHWNRSRSGRARLTIGSLRQVEALFKQLIKSTDRGVSQLLSSRYGLRPNWK